MSGKSIKITGINCLSFQKNNFRVDPISKINKQTSTIDKHRLEKSSFQKVLEDKKNKSFDKDK